MEKNERLNQKKRKKVNSDRFFFKLDKSRCCVPTCKSKFKFGNIVDIRFHQFPSGPVLFNKWKRAVLNGNEPSESSKVCSLHFKPEDFQKQPTRWHVPVLRGNAIPTQNLPPGPVDRPSRQRPPLGSSQSSYRTRLSTGTVVRKSHENGPPQAFVAPRRVKKVDGTTVDDHHSIIADKGTFLLNYVIKQEPAEEYNIAQSVAHSKRKKSKTGRWSRPKRRQPTQETSHLSEGAAIDDCDIVKVEIDPFAADSSPHPTGKEEVLVGCNSDPPRVKTEPVEGTAKPLAGCNSDPPRVKTEPVEGTAKPLAGYNSDPPRVKTEPVEGTAKPLAGCNSDPPRVKTEPVEGTAKSLAGYNSDPPRVKTEPVEGTAKSLAGYNSDPPRVRTEPVKGTAKPLTGCNSNPPRVKTEPVEGTAKPLAGCNSDLPRVETEPVEGTAKPSLVWVRPDNSAIAFANNLQKSRQVLRQLCPRLPTQSCGIPNCSGTSPSGQRLTLFGLPNNSIWKDRWLEAIDGAVEVLDTASSCPKHRSMMPLDACNSLSKMPGCSPAYSGPVAIPGVRRCPLVCSTHFRDGRPTAKNPIPDLELNGKAEEGEEVRPEVHFDHTYAEAVKAETNTVGIRVPSKPIVLKSSKQDVSSLKRVSIIEISTCFSPAEQDPLEEGNVDAGDSSATSQPAATATSQPAATATSQPAATATSQPAATATSQPAATATSHQATTATSHQATTATSQPAATATPPPPPPPAASVPADRKNVNQDHNYSILTEYDDLDKDDHTYAFVISDVKNSESAIWGQYSVSPLAQACYTAGSLPTGPFTEDQEMFEVAIKKEVEDEDTQSDPLFADRCFATHWQQTPTTKLVASSSVLEPARPSIYESSNSGDAFSCAAAASVKQEPADEGAADADCGNFQFVDMGSFMSDFKSELEELGSLDSIFSS